VKELTALTSGLNEFCKAYENGHFIPLLEADVAGYLYYLLVKRNKGDASRTHLSTRIRSKGENKKFPDIVVGDVLTREEQVQAYEKWAKSHGTSSPMSKEEVLRGLRTRDFDEYSRPLVAPIEVAVEVKALLKGFEYRQLRRRTIEAKADIKALSQSVNAKQRLLLLFDEARFLTRKHKRDYLDDLMKLRKQQEQEVDIIYVSVAADGKCSWKFL
jgi:hypothetical protein